MLEGAAGSGSADFQCKPDNAAPAAVKPPIHIELALFRRCPETILGELGQIA